MSAWPIIVFSVFVGLPAVLGLLAIIAEGFSTKDPDAYQRQLKEKAELERKQEIKELAASHHRLMVAFFDETLPVELRIQIMKQLAEDILLSTSCYDKNFPKLDMYIKVARVAEGWKDNYDVEESVRRVYRSVTALRGCGF